MHAAGAVSRYWFAALALLLAATPSLAQEPKVLRVTMHADVRTLDPFWTTQTIAGIHGMMVYDTLFSSDADLKPQPQMVDKWTVSEDRKVYEFSLRDGLELPRWFPGDEQGRGRLDEPLGQARWRRQAAFRLHGISGRQGRQDFRVDAQGALRAC